MKLITEIKAIEGDAAKVLKWLASTDVKVGESAPKAIAALAVIVAAADKALNDTAAIAANPTSLVLNFGSDIADVKAVWPDVKAFVGTLGITL